MGGRRRDRCVRRPIVDKASTKNDHDKVDPNDNLAAFTAEIVNYYHAAGRRGLVQHHA